MQVLRRSITKIHLVKSIGGVSLVSIIVRHKSSVITTLVLPVAIIGGLPIVNTESRARLRSTLPVIHISFVSYITEKPVGLQFVLITLSEVISMENNLYAVRITTDDRIELVETVGGCDEIHRLVGGYFENVWLYGFPASDVIMVVDESGKLAGKPVNLIASCIYGNAFDVIVGDVLLLKLERVGEYNELDELPFTKDQAEIVKQCAELYRDHPRRRFYERLKEHYESFF